jgi:hypothetical protein
MARNMGIVLSVSLSPIWSGWIVIKHTDELALAGAKGIKVAVIIAATSIVVQLRPLCLRMCAQGEQRQKAVE